MTGEGFLQGIIFALLSTGGATFIWTCVKAYLAVRGRVDNREDRVMERLEQSESECRDELARERAWGRYWFRRAGQLEHVLIVRGIEYPDAGPEPHKTDWQITKEEGST